MAEPMTFGQMVMATTFSIASPRYLPGLGEPFITASGYRTLGSRSTSPSANDTWRSIPAEYTPRAVSAAVPTPSEAADDWAEADRLVTWGRERQNLDLYVAEVEGSWRADAVERQQELEEAEMQEARVRADYEKEFPALPAAKPEPVISKKQWKVSKAKKGAEMMARVDSAMAM